MNKYFLVLTILTVLLRSECSSINKLSESVHIEGQWKQAAVAEPIGPCQPCIYSLSFDHESGQFLIYNQKNVDQTLRFQLTRSQQQNQMVFLDRQFKFTGIGLMRNNNYSISVKIQSQPKDGARYFYLVQSSEIGLYIESNSKQNQYSIIIRTVAFCAILWVFIPMNKSTLQKSMVETHKRTCLYSLYLYSQLIITISTIQGILVIQYILNQKSILFRIVCYCLMGFTFLSCLVHSVYSIAIVQKKLNDYLREKGMYKFAISFLSLFIGLIFYPFYLMFFHKSIWYFYFISSGIILQFVISKMTKTLPYKKFILLYSIFLVQLLTQTDQYSILNFNQTSYIQILIFIIYLVLLNIGGAWTLRNTGNLQNIANIFGIYPKQKSIQVENTDETNQENITKNDQTKKHIGYMKSDIQMQPTFD